MNRKRMNLIGQKYGYLTVLEEAEKDKNGKRQLLCKCDCGNIKVVKFGSLRSGLTKSCGCLQRESASKLSQLFPKKYNVYDLSGDCGVGWTFNTNEPFYFDLEDYDKIKDYCWYKSHKYIVATIWQTNKKIFLHKFIFGVGDDRLVDHKDREPLNCQKSNLRLATITENTRNRKLPSSSTSGIIGVSWKKDKNRWRAYITLNHKQIILGYFVNKESAIKTRLEAEAQYFKDFSPQKHLFKQYGVSIDE